MGFACPQAPGIPRTSRRPPSMIPIMSVLPWRIVSLAPLLLSTGFARCFGRLCRCKRIGGLGKESGYGKNPAHRCSRPEGILRAFRFAGFLKQQVANIDDS